MQDNPASDFGDAEGHAHMDNVGRPLPVPDQSSEGFWAAASDHVLAIQHCGHCDNAAHPPVIVCSACLSPDSEFDFRPISGTGRMRTWTVIQDPFLPGFRAEVPYIIADVEFDDVPDVRMVARLTIDGEAPLVIGAPTETTFEDVASGIALPRFRLLRG